MGAAACNGRGGGGSGGGGGGGPMAKPFAAACPNGFDVNADAIDADAAAALLAAK